MLESNNYAISETLFEQVPVGGVSVVYIPELARVVVEAGRLGIDGGRYLVADAYLSTSDMAYALHAVGLASSICSCYALRAAR